MFNIKKFTVLQTDENQTIEILGQGKRTVIRPTAGVWYYGGSEFETNPDAFSIISSGVALDIYLEEGDKIIMKTYSDPYDHSVEVFYSDLPGGSTGFTGTIDLSIK